MNSWKLDQIATALMVGVLGLLVVASPWAFGSTTSAVVRATNLIAYGLGFLCVARWILRFRTGRWPVRWGGHSLDEAQRRRESLLLWALLIVHALLLGYSALSAWNARMGEGGGGVGGLSAYFDAILWLPHSYDREGTWSAFRTSLGLAFVFWAAWDWLSETPPSEVAGLEHGRRILLPPRLKLLLWVLTLNGFCLALEGVLQRLSGTSKLLWMVQPHINQQPSAQFGPFAYRSNGAQYLNLIWPCALGFWWSLREEQRRSIKRVKLGGGSHWLVLLSAIFMALAPFVSISRGGIAVTLFLMGSCGLILMRAMGARHWKLLSGMTGLFVLAGAFGCFLVWPQLSQRLAWDDTWSGRKQIYENSAQIIADHPWFGTGPGSFVTVYGQYRQTSGEEWHAYLHNDWMQLRMEWGLAGFILVIVWSCLVLGIVVARRRGAAPGGLVWMFVSALGGCLLHARFDFPFQVHSIHVLFLVLVAALLSFGGRSLSGLSIASAPD